MERYLTATKLLDIDHPIIVTLCQERKWMQLDERSRILAIYNFVRDEILFGYNAADTLSASQVVVDGYGQCNTKTTLLMTLLRASNIPCRFHGFTIDKSLQKGAIDGLFYWLTPRSIIHSWTEVWFENQWLNLEGCILDRAYLTSVQERFTNEGGNFCGFGIATPQLQAPQVDWDGKHTYIQKEGINQDFGVFDDPDAFYGKHGSNLRGLKRLMFVHWIRHRLNHRVKLIRARRWDSIL
ncbi:transglutaminase family protein [Undibacterium cyanobacteriorum]|uniref:Transglutaminase family protein n=1 Tax=Undibacterium cyanobacteriorum TaxID=3073561 RepID=A0ABY9RGS6_9BURK|nr:transglutaminase family protein [Undibacterium sp. 20NA77.5]WMW80053.1 transglutaminase family protein [Undibacterium sp. 20NA77.5]